MLTRNINLASEMEWSEKENLVKLEALRAAVLAGEESGVAGGDAMGEIRQRVRRRALVMESLRG